jgi:hypothetical protein
MSSLILYNKSKTRQSKRLFQETSSTNEVGGLRTLPCEVSVDRKVFLSGRDRPS